MIRIIIVVALAVAGASSADAATRKSARPQAHALQTAVVAARPIAPARPSWAAAGECYTDDGYGRFWPCSGGPCGR